MGNFLLPADQAKQVVRRIVAICESDSILAYISKFEGAEAFVVTCALEREGEVISFCLYDAFESLVASPGQRGIKAAWDRRIPGQVTVAILIYLPQGGAVTVGRNIIRPI